MPVHRAIFVVYAIDLFDLVYFKLLSSHECEVYVVSFLLGHLAGHWHYCCCALQTRRRKENVLILSTSTCQSSDGM